MKFPANRRPAAFAAINAAILGAALLAASLTTAFAAPDHIPASPPKRYSDRDDVRAFIGDMVREHGFVRKELEALFRKAVRQPDIIRAMTPPPEAPVRSWQAYRNFFVNPQRIEAGLRFGARHADILRRAETRYGVPAEIIMAIIGVETSFGRNMGRYRIIDALTTLAFDYPRRAEYFRSELEHFLLFARDGNIDVLRLRGSYAGAFGMPQFMPGSYRRYAVDFDGDGRADLVASASDAIGSVANFLKEHGWESGRPIAFPVALPPANAGTGDAIRSLLEAGIKPSLPLERLAAAGVQMPPALARLAPDTLATVVELETPGQPAVAWAGLQNFYVLTRYNRSSFYATAILELATALREAGAANTAPPGVPESPPAGTPGVPAQPAS